MPDPNQSCIYDGDKFQAVTPAGAEKANEVLANGGDVGCRASTLYARENGTGSVVNMSETFMPGFQPIDQLLQHHGVQRQDYRPQQINGGDHTNDDAAGQMRRRAEHNLQRGSLVPHR